MATTEFKRKVGFSDVKPPQGQNRGPRIDELVDMLQWPKKATFVQMRFLRDELIAEGVHKVEIITKKGEKVPITKSCLAFDPESQDRDSTKKCPYCKMPNQRFSLRFYANAIIRELQEDQPKKLKDPTKKERKTGFKDIDSESWTPVRVVRLPVSVAHKLHEMGDLNKIKDKKTGKVKSYAISHSVHGRDIGIKFDPKKSGTDMYSIDKGERTPLTDEEKEYLVWDLSVLPGPEEKEVAKTEAAKLLKMAPEDEKKKGKDEDEEEQEQDEQQQDEEQQDEQDDDDDDLTSKKSKKGKKGKKKKAKDEDEEEQEQEQEEEEEEEEQQEEEQEEEEQEQQDEEEQEEEEDEKPKKKGKKSKSRDEDDEDEDEEDEDESPKRKKKSKGKKKDDDDDDIDLDDIDEQQEEQQDEQEQDEDEDEQEEDEKPKKKKKK